LRTVTVVLALLLTACSPTSPNPVNSPVPTPSCERSIPDLPPCEYQVMTEVSDKEAQFLGMLSGRNVPHSASGKPEILIGKGVCSELDKHTDQNKIIEGIMTMGWSRQQAEIVFESAISSFCPRVR
jgi:hypothetical protein